MAILSLPWIFGYMKPSYDVPLALKPCLFCEETERRARGPFKEAALVYIAPCFAGTSRAYILAASSTYLASVVPGYPGDYLPYRFVLSIVCRIDCEQRDDAQACRYIPNSTSQLSQTRHVHINVCGTLLYATHVTSSGLTYTYEYHYMKADAWEMADGLLTCKDPALHSHSQRMSVMCRQSFILFDSCSRTSCEVI